MKKLLLTLLFGILGVGVYGQTIKSLGYNTTNGQVVYNGTNTLTFTNGVFFNQSFKATEIQDPDGVGVIGIIDGYIYNTNGVFGIGIEFTGANITLGLPLTFFTNTHAATTRTNLGLGLSALTNTNVTIFRTAIGLGETNKVTFGGIANNGNFTNSSGTIYGFKTNVGPFEGIGNFFASNNTTVGNETLFRVGVAETTNKSAQFGFRVARTNNGGEGLAVFSVFGYNALMMIGPSDRSRSNSLTNTNAAIEADIWTMSETNRVMTLRDTNTGATVMHRPIGFNTNEVSTTAPSNTTVTNPTGWIQIYVGTNSVRVPYYQ